MATALHNLSHSKKLSCNMGEIVPIALFDVLPGDRIDHIISGLMRTQPLATPVMHEVEFDIHTWFVPNRIMQPNFEEFITGGPDGLNSTVAPYMLSPSGGYQQGSLADYLGLPLGVANLKHSAFPFRAYGMIYNNFYRDEQLQPEVVVSTGDGLDTTTSRDLKNGCWNRDRFTSARPSPQLGGDTYIPLTGDAPVRYNSTGTAVINDQIAVLNKDAGGVTTTRYSAIEGGGSSTNAPNSSSSSMYADLSAVSAVDIESLREASAIQRFKEWLNTTGSRYVEYLQSFFGVRPQDARLQLPEYLGGGTTKIQFSEVLQTAEGENPVGTMAGHGIAAQRSNRYKRYIPEHGWILSFMIVRPKTQYMQGLDKMWSRDSKFDYFQPPLAFLGDQPVLNKEVYAAHSTPDSVFGYQPYGDEYRYLPSQVSGEFRTLMKDWHMAREFTSDVALNGTFVTANPTNRIYQVQDQAYDQLLLTLNHRILAKRKVPKKSKPRLF